MAIDQPPEVNLEDPDRRFPILEWLVEGKLPSDQMEARRIARRAKAFVLIDGKSTNVGLPAYSCGASSGIKAASCCKKYIPTPAVTTPVREHLSEKLSDKVSTGPWQSLTRRTSCGVVKGSSSMLDKLTSQRKRSRQSPSRGPLPSGTSTWWGHSNKRLGASPTFS
jgi:hypothetical protein